MFDSALFSGRLPGAFWALLYRFCCHWHADSQCNEPSANDVGLSHLYTTPNVDNSALEGSEEQAKRVSETLQKMSRALSPPTLQLANETQGFALGWDDGAPLALS
jgi:hypothetical protein